MKIYDCFTFYNEYELLELRLETLYSVVDYFVICELDVKQNGEKKTYYFEKEKDRFKKYSDKIIHLKESDAPTLKGKQIKKTSDDTMDGDWSIENYQRNCIIHGLMNCRPDDLIMISDLDEIPNPKIIENLWEQKVYTYPLKLFEIKKWFRALSYIILYSKNISFLKKIMMNNVFVKDIIAEMPIALQMDIYYYFINCRSRGKWNRPIIGLYKNISMPQVMRNIADKAPYIKNGGWHFSYMGGIEKIKQKLSSIIEGNAQLASDENFLINCIKNGRDIYGRKGNEFIYEFVPIDSLDVPNLKSFIEKYPQFLWEDNG